MEDSSGIVMNWCSSENFRDGEKSTVIGVT